MGEQPLTEAVGRLLADREVLADAARLGELVELARRDLADPPDGDGTQQWCNLGAALYHLWRRTGDPAVLGECVDASRQAVSTAVAAGRWAEPLRDNLIRVLLEQAEVTRAPALLDEALDVAADLLAEPDEPTEPATTELIDRVLVLCEAQPGPPSPRYTEVRRRFVAAYAGNALSTAWLLIGEARRYDDLALLEEAGRLVGQALDAPAEDPVVRSERLHARAVTAELGWRMRRRPADLDDAFTAYAAAVSLAEEAGEVPAGLLHNYSLAYGQRYERDGDVADLSAAIALHAAVTRDDDEAVRTWQSRMAELRWDRYEATADLADLDAAVDLTRRVVPGGEVRGLAPETLLSNLRQMLAVRQLYREDPAVATELVELSEVLGPDIHPSGLVSPRPWTRTYADDPAGAPVPAPPVARRVLYLRTFKDPAADVVVLRHLAAALGQDDRVVLLSDARDEAALAASVADRLELVSTTDADWTRVVHEEMAAATAIVLHLSPKDLAFPRVSRPRDLSGEFPRELWEIGPDAGPAHQARVMLALRDFERLRGDTIEATPLGAIPTGAGLLRELAYLDRLDRLGQTVVVADNLHYYHLSRRVENAWISQADVTTIDGGFHGPRVTALERQLGVLDDDVTGITFSAPEDGTLSPAFTTALAAALAPMTAARPRPAADELPLGTSPEPRNLPPDGEPKVLTATPVEDLVVIPPGSFVEIPPEDIRSYFEDAVLAAGCPRCGGPLSAVFFYTAGLTRPPLNDIGTVDTHGKCQTCGRRSTVWGPDALADF